MKKLQWVAVAAVLGLGILYQIPHHDHGQLPDHEQEHTAALTAAAGDPEAVVSLAVSGMT